MKHLSEEELIGYRENEAMENTVIAEHLRECADCRAEFTRLDAELTAVFAALDTLEVPEPGRGYGQRVWNELAPRLKPLRDPANRLSERVAWWQGWFAPRRLAAFAAVAALAVLAFLAGRGTVLPFDDEDARAAGSIRADFESSGRIIGPYDLLIAGQAMAREAKAVGAEGVGFKNLRARLQVLLVDGQNEPGVGEV